jgi:UDP-N-acetylmuramoylalanine--D-glutamate ligase
LDVAVEKSTADALKSEENQPVVLLSPACASFDQFRNFEIRGERFRELVKAIAGFEGTGKTA